MTSPDLEPPAPAAVTWVDDELLAAVLDEVALTAAATYGDVEAALGLARGFGAAIPPPGGGRTRERWSWLSTLGAADLTTARVVEPHVDALAILGEAVRSPGLPDVPEAPDESVWGVFAAEGPGVRLQARGQADGSWTLSGTKPWCSLGDRVSHALVTAWYDDEQRGLFAVGLQQPGVRSLDQPWVSHGLANITSGPLTFDAVPAVPVGGPGWYLSRPGFAWGGIGVAAVWLGGAIGVTRRMQRQARERELDQVGQLLLGSVDAALYGAGASLCDAADAVDRGDGTGSDGSLLAYRVRQVMADTAELVLRDADHALGPAPLTQEREHADRVADLRTYLRQHHGERDAAAEGRLVSERPPW